VVDAGAAHEGKLSGTQIVTRVPRLDGPPSSLFMR
jgi:hypothetical protein